MTDNQPKRQRYDHELLGSDFAHNAEQAIIPENKPRNIVTPCHGAALEVTYRYVGSHSEVEYLWCQHPDCPNTWNEDGTVDYWENPA